HMLFFIEYIYEPHGLVFERITALKKLVTPCIKVD
ncbi:MAG: hypothetical protein ACI81G_001928, partial [Gammaproteobacteria bacterium]